MTTSISGKDLAAKLAEKFPAGIEAAGDAVIVKPADIVAVMTALRDNLDFKFLNYVTAVDYYRYFEIVYYLTSISNNQSIVVKTRVQGRKNLTVPSIVSVFEGANVQEREIFDLMGITFTGHPNLKRLLLWEGFQGHPLRKDFLIDGNTD